MIVDEETTSDVRASAQNLYNLVFIGVGIMAGSWVSLSVVGAWAKEDTGEMNYTKLFSAPLWASLACLAILTFLYPGGRRGAAVKNLTAASPA
jgi:hypothetical protein